MPGTFHINWERIQQEIEQRGKGTVFTVILTLMHTTQDQRRRNNYFTNSGSDGPTLAMMRGLALQLQVIREHADPGVMPDLHERCFVGLRDDIVQAGHGTSMVFTDAQLPEGSEIGGRINSDNTVYVFRTSDGSNWVWSPD